MFTKLASDDYSAKFRAWIRTPRLFVPAEPRDLPRFGHRRFGSYNEFNAWKREYLREIARCGGVRWKS